MNNYKRLYVGKDDKGKRIFIDEHRKIMEDYLGRKLKRNEVVHHKDGNKNNNKLDNLEVMSLSKHSKMHQSGVKRSIETKKKISEANRNRIYNNRNKTEQDIINIVLKYKEKHNFRYVDRYFGFSNKTTRDIIKGLSYKDYQPLIQELLKNN
jgi:hypothetical protein